MRGKAPRAVCSPAAVWRAGRIPVRAMLDELGAAAVLRNHLLMKERSLDAARGGDGQHLIVLDLHSMVRAAWLVVCRVWAANGMVGVGWGRGVTGCSRARAR